MDGTVKRLRDVFRHADWITLDRVRGYSILLIMGYVIAFVVWWIMADGLRDHAGHPIGTDFVNVYAAGQMVHQGHAAEVYDWMRHAAVEHQVVGFDAPYYGWHYPPMFLGVATLVACLPYLSALFAYLAVGFAAYMEVIGSILPRPKLGLLAAAAFPGVFINIGNGQNGFITTAILGTGLVCLERQPYLAGVLFGLLAYKPQFFILVPFALLCRGSWHALLTTAFVSLLSAALSYAVFGADVWQSFFTSTHLTQGIILEQGAAGWNKIQSIFSMVRMAGGDTIIAYILHGVVAMAAVAGLAIIWRRRAATLETRAAALVAAALLATPYVMDYDLMVLAIPIAFLVRQGGAGQFQPYEKTLLAILWVLPFIARLAGAGGLMLTPFVLIALLTLCYQQSKIAVA